MSPSIHQKLNIPDQIPLGEYLFLRISQANPRLRSVFGIAGDFSLNLLEHLYADSVKSQRQLNFVGFCNELNAAYAVNGYSRAIEGLGVLLTTFGVGELSALNGIASSFSEFVPILHVVGTSSRQQREYARSQSLPVHNYHHLVQNKNQLLAPNHNVYMEACKDFCVVQETLESGDDHALDQIDHVLRTILQSSRPGYLFVPKDVPDLMVSTARLRTFSPSVFEFNGAHSRVLHQACDAILDVLYKSKAPSVMSDLMVTRFNLQDKLLSLVKQFDPSHQFLRLFSTNMARNFNESLPNYVGVYYGKVSSSARVQHEIEQLTDSLFIFGHVNMETNTATYTTDLSNIANYVEINHDYILVNGQYFHAKDGESRLFTLEDVVDRLASRFDPAHYAHQPLPVNVVYKYEPSLTTHQNNDDFITQTKVLDFISNYLQPNDIIVIETCALLFGIPEVKFPPGVQFISQQFYASIGHALPATVGVTFAVNDLGQTNRRIIAFEGDGSAQMVIQDLSTLVRYADILPVKPKFFLLNNDGYTIERFIKGPDRSYNDIVGFWNWTEMLKVMGDPQQKVHRSIKLLNDDELDKFMVQQADADSEKIEIIELIMGKYDVPNLLKTFVGKPQ